MSISPRRNNKGKRFSFVCFVEVDEGRLFIVRLDNIMIAGRKIHVNLPHYQRGKLGKEAKKEFHMKARDNVKGARQEVSVRFKGGADSR